MPSLICTAPPQPWHFRLTNFIAQVEFQQFAWNRGSVKKVHGKSIFQLPFARCLRLSSLCPHGIAINKVAMAALKDVPLQVYLLRQSSRGFGWDSRSEAAVLTPEIPGRAAILIETAFVIPPMRTQEAVIELERAPVLQRIYNKVSVRRTRLDDVLVSVVLRSSDAAAARRCFWRAA